MSDEIPVETYDQGPALKPILFNILSIFFVVLSCLCPGFSLVIFAAPNSALNPLRPVPPATATLAASPTQTPLIYFPPTWTPTATLEPSATRTRLPSGVSMPTDTLVYNPNPETTRKPFFPFVVEGGNPTYSASPKGCAWLGVAGVVYSLDHSPIDNLIVQLHGKISGNTFDGEQITGSADGIPPGGFEFKLADQPVLSLNSVWIQLLDGTRKPISDKIIFNTYAGCYKNLITANLIQVNP